MPREEWTATDVVSRKDCHEKKTSAKKKKNKRQPLPSSSPALFRLIQSRNWSECLRRCSSNPQDIYHMENEMSVLHFALYKRPEIINETAAAAAHQEVEFLKFIDYLLVKAGPELLSAVDGKFGYTPLHIVCSSNSNNKHACIRLVQMILDHCPPPNANALHQTIKTMTLGTATTPLPLEITTHIWQFLPNPALMQDKHGKTPLFLACQRSKKRKNHQPCIAVVQRLLEYAPAAMNIQDKTFRTPLDVLLHQGKSQEIIELFKAASSKQSQLHCDHSK